MKHPPDKCQNKKCRAIEVILVDTYLHKDDEYREEFECQVCSTRWTNFYKYSKTERTNEERVG